MGSRKDAYKEGRRSTPMQRELQQRTRSSGPDGPPDKDGCALVLLGWASGAVVAAVAVSRAKGWA
jgi:hypothetical protein